MDLPKYQTLKPTSSPLDFFRERGNVMETEHGWCNFYLLPNNGAYLENFYVYPEFRQSQKGTSMFNILEMTLKEIHGVKDLTTTISLHFNNVERALQVCLKRGFKFYSASNDAIILKKEL